jgi:hypothetical protein
MVAAAVPVADNAVYNGPYVSGEEYEMLLDAERRMDAAWKIAQEDIED